MTVQRTFSAFTLLLCLALLLPGLVQRGMFMDGLLYTVVAHNQAHGFGSFWEPRFSQLGFAGLSHFHEHPPLVFGIQAAWFRLLGDAFWVERAYCLLLSGITALLIAGIWRSLWPAGSREQVIAWWPILLWIIIPPVHWSLRNNMQENTMTVFCLAAVWCVVHGLQHVRRLYLPAVLAGVFTLAAVLSKGPPGAFPLAAPLLWSIGLRDGRIGRAMAFTGWMGLALVGMFGVLMLWPEARTSLHTYVEQRLMHRLGDAPTEDHRWRILQHLVNALLGPVAVTLVLVRIGRSQGVVQVSRRKALALAAIGLSGVLPLMLTMVQKSFYMVQGLGVLALALAYWSAPSLAALLARAEGKVGLMRVLQAIVAVGLLTVVVVAAMRWGRPGRDADMLHDVALIGSVVPAHAIIGAEAGLWSEWNLQSYLMRDHFISIDPKGIAHQWHLSFAHSDRPPGHMSKVGLPLRHYQLWQDHGGAPSSVR